MPDLDMALPTRPDIGRYRELRMSATKPELIMSSIVGSRCRPMSDNVGSVIFGYYMVENVGVAVGIASPCVFVVKLFPLRFPLPVSWPTLALPMSADIGPCRQCHF